MNKGWITFYQGLNIVTRILFTLRVNLNIIRIGWGGYAPMGVAVNPNTGRLYAADYESSSISVVDCSTNTVVSNIKLSG